MVTVFPSICHVTLVGGEPVEMQVRLDEPESELVLSMLGGAAEKSNRVLSDVNIVVE